ncbi:5-dehydro-4-deoxy-D-glucuronate isomerase [Arenicella xantha]|uniref:4-deoxy-L-threo-5-hexosulose-uronate ketol-isomerase n=1 Tax=Arenicella xantha TaxID=644221 RepID=A0A395JNF1_9GAMM|nr:5-dehydro-4-deoxy-D-glucuronate isomerase [Arenicella xantha]RBP53007.1 4-deoxy-L-threo-5-hexosulose-uronate ketol-isomerase [Arenicella xantha]
MTTHYEERYAVHPADYEHYNMERLRENFHVDGLFVEGEINLVYTQIDRFIVGGACPTSSALNLDAVNPLKADHFLDRRELGAINVGGAGSITVDGETYAMAYKEALYIGAGVKEVTFASDDPTQPAKFYLNSATAHHSYPVKKVGLDDAIKLELGSLETSNHRVINKLLVSGVVETCQLQMGMTELKPGSVWNTMPAHTHGRRMETYFYFEVPEEQAVCHFMGPRHETRHIWVANEQAVISPTWSIHSGAGTSNYTFIWGMAGENLDYDDMDKLTPADFASSGD